MHGYVEGYRRAASAVFEAAVTTRQSPEYTLWPLAFLWRHHLELALKEIIAIGRDLEGEDRTFPEHHRLADLWREAKQHIVGFSSPDVPELPHVEATVDEFATIDPGADGFRYPVARGQRRASLPNAPPDVNIPALHEAMEAVANFLECVHDSLRNAVDANREMADH